MAQLKLGDKIRVKGPNGATVTIIVGRGFTLEDLQRMLRKGELTLINDIPSSPPVPTVEAVVEPVVESAPKAPAKKPRKATKKAEKK